MISCKNINYYTTSTSLIPQLVQAVILPQHDTSVGVQSSSGALKHLALKCQSEMFNFVLPINSHTKRFGLTVLFRRYPSSFYESYPIVGASTSTSLMPQLVQEVIPPQHVVIFCFYTNKQKAIKIILKWYCGTERFSPLPKETTFITPL